MSGDVQPRKRKDKKKKKDELGVEEPSRGTSAIFGEGDVFLHSQHEHGTGGHWCAKVVFFSLLAILLTLIGLIILETRGLSELEANQVQTQYSGVLEGWLEDAADDDHHDIHTLELKHHDDDHDDPRDSEEHEDFENGDEDDDEDEEHGDDDDDESQDPDDDEDEEADDEHDDGDDDDDDEVEVEKIEAEASDEEPITADLPPLPEEDDDDSQGDDDKDEEDELDNDNDDNDSDGGDDGDDDDFLDNDVDKVLPVVERITAPAGKPFVEVDSEDSAEAVPADSLAEEEAYERQQEQLRREQEQASHMWLKLGVGAALLAATHAVVRRAARPRDEAEQENENQESREETPVVDRRMTLIPEQAAAPPKEGPKEIPKPNIQQEIAKNLPFIIKSAPAPTQMSLEEAESQEDQDDIETIDANSVEELYSDEEVEEEELEEEEVIEKKIESPKQSVPVETKVIVKQPEPEESEPEDDDVEIIDEEQIDEEPIDEEDEEEISDVDDAELLSRLEAKYGRLPEPERSGPKPKDGGNSVEDSWPGEPGDAFWRQELDKAEEELRQGSWEAAVTRASAAELATSSRARFVVAKALDRMAEDKKDNKLLNKAIAAYVNVLKMADGIEEGKLLEITNRTLNRIQFRGTYLSAEPIHKLLIRRFPDHPGYRNNLTITYLMANRADLAEEVLKETLARWPADRVALAHYGFILKTEHKRYEEAVTYLSKALEGDTGPAAEPRFYYHLGDALLLLGKNTEAHEIHKRGAFNGHFLSPQQRSLYNVDRLKSRPFWSVEQTPYAKLVEALERSWKEILKEGEALAALYEEEKEGLRQSGEWSQLDLFARGREVPGRCALAPVTCSIIKSEAAARSCSRGQAKFSLMAPGTHVRAHVGPTNCRLRVHLGLKNTDDTFLRVHKETRQWQVGKALIFDDSFEHEVWHRGAAPRLVLIVDVWHPQLTAPERRQLPPI